MISLYRMLFIIAFQQLTMRLKVNAYFITVDETKFHLVKVILLINIILYIYTSRRCEILY